MKMKTFKRASFLASLAVCGLAAQAAEWSDTAIS